MAAGESIEPALVTLFWPDLDPLAELPVGDDDGGAGSRDEYGINTVAVTLKSRQGTVISVE